MAEGEGESAVLSAMGAEEGVHTTTLCCALLWQCCILGMQAAIPSKKGNVTCVSSPVCPRWCCLVLLFCSVLFCSLSSRPVSRDGGVREASALSARYNHYLGDLRAIRHSQRRRWLLLVYCSLRHRRQRHPDSDGRGGRGHDCADSFTLTLTKDKWLLSEEQIERLVDEAEKHKEEDAGRLGPGIGLEAGQDKVCCTVSKSTVLWRAQRKGMLGRHVYRTRRTSAIVHGKCT